jgi:hypothetical protein
MRLSAIASLRESLNLSFSVAENRLTNLRVEVVIHKICYLSLERLAQRDKAISFRYTTNHFNFSFTVLFTIAKFIILSLRGR